jgi:hypothetical protein
MHSFYKTELTYNAKCDESTDGRKEEWRYDAHYVAWLTSKQGI